MMWISLKHLHLAQTFNLEFNGPSCCSELCHIFLDRPVLGYQDASHHCRYVSLLSGAKAFLLIPASSFHIDVSAGELSMTRAKTD